MSIKKLGAWSALALSAALANPAAHARDTVYRLSFAELLDSSEAKQKLDPSIKFFLAGQKTPKVLTKYSEELTNRKTNGVGKDDETGCRWAALSGLLALQDKARAAGANAVIDVVSYYKKGQYSSTIEYECHAGAVVIGVALKGTVAKVVD